MQVPQLLKESEPQMKCFQIAEPEHHKIIYTGNVIWLNKSYGHWKYLTKQNVLQLTTSNNSNSEVELWKMRKMAKTMPNYLVQEH